eukprot:TRINITY_DN2511_c0_g1_i2.p1 TRINITY_DN2511_c0_g1~~TRINITY_DN2511_c0_g1_i2.p1  ORF type:complete len:142 (+),score=45.91 TRINITY_DN2511_c0_g1_i2:145-570(+)
MIRRPPRSTLSSSSAASDVYKRQYQRRVRGPTKFNMDAPKEETAALTRTPSMEWTLEELFQDIDTDHDGQISKEEFRDAFTGRRAVRLREKLAVAAAFGCGSEDPEAWMDVFRRLDSDASESVSLEEFTMAAIHGLGCCMD